MAPIRTYSLTDLAEKTGLTERAIRSYLTRGLIPRSDRLGRGARYPHSTLERLQVINRFRTEGPATVTLEQIAELLDQLDDEMITAIATGRMPIQLVDDGREEARVAELRTETLESRTGPREPVLGSPAPSRREPRPAARLRMGGDESPTMVFTPGAATSAAPRQLDELIKRLRFAERALGTAGRFRESIETPAEWHRVSAGKDLEIHARGPLSADDLALLKEAAELLALMLRGPSGSRLQQITIDSDAGGLNP